MNITNLLIFIIIILASWKCLEIGLWIGDKITQKQQSRK